MPAAGLRRWSAAGRELRERDPARYTTLLRLSEMAIRAHRQLRQLERSGHDLAVRVRAIADVAAEVGRPRTRRAWGAVAIAAAKRAGLEGPDVDSLRVNLEDQWRIDEGERLKRGDVVRLPAAAGGGTAVVEACRYDVIPVQVVVSARGGKRQTIPADLVTLVPAPRRRRKAGGS